MLKGLCIFAAGAVVGMFASREIFRKHYQELADEEIQEVREHYKNKDKEIEEVKEEVKVEEYTVEEKIQYNHIIDENGYTHYDYSHVLPKKEDDQKSKVPAVPQETGYIIDAEEFGNIPEYDTMSITYYADGIVTDDVDDIIEDFEVILGTDFIDVFADFDASSVYVRNDIWKTDYEILRDDWFYSDCHKDEAPKTEEPYKHPHQF